MSFPMIKIVLTQLAGPVTLNRPKAGLHFVASSIGYADASQPSSYGVFYTYWDYQVGAWQRDHGVELIIFCFHQRRQPARKVIIDRDPRGWKNHLITHQSVRAAD